MRGVRGGLAQLRVDLHGLAVGGIVVVAAEEVWSLEDVVVCQKVAGGWELRRYPFEAATGAGYAAVERICASVPSLLYMQPPPDGFALSASPTFFALVRASVEEAFVAVPVVGADA